MSLIEEIQCENKTQLLTRERYWFDYYKEKQPELCVNKKKPILTDKEKQINHIKALKYINNRYHNRQNELEWDLT